MTDDNNIYISDDAISTVTISTADTTLTWGDDDYTIDLSGLDTLTADEFPVSEEYNYAQRIERLEELLGLPKRDFDLETKHPELRDLYEEQVQKVKQTLAGIDYSEYTEEVEKKRVWERLNK